MAGRLPSLLLPPIGFAYGGASANAPANSAEAFVLALRLGATGIHTNVRLTADGHVVLLADAVTGSMLRRRRVADSSLADLPADTVTLGAFYLACGTDTPLLLDVADPSAAAASLEVARNLGAERHLWLGHTDLEVLATWRSFDPRIRLVHNAHRDHLPFGPERHASELTRLQIDAVQFHHSQWSGGNIALYHRFGRLTIGGEAEFPRLIGGLLDAGIDGISSTHADLLASGLDAFGRSPSGQGVTDRQDD